MNVSTVTSSSRISGRALERAQSAELGVNLVVLSKEVPVPALGAECPSPRLLVGAGHQDRAAYAPVGAVGNTTRRLTALAIHRPMIGQAFV